MSKVSVQNIQRRHSRICQATNIQFVPAKRLSGSAGAEFEARAYPSRRLPENGFITRSSESFEGKETRPKRPKA